MGVATLELLTGDRVYLVDGDGKHWRVYDATVADGRLRIYRPPRAGAETRIFVGVDRSRWSHRFPEGDARQLTAVVAERQLKASVPMGEQPKRLGWAEARLRVKR